MESREQVTNVPEVGDISSSGAREKHEVLKLSKKGFGF
jgi:hypothetical protein